MNSRKKYKMTKGTLVIIIFLLASSWKAYPQHLSHQVLVPAAGIALTGLPGYSQTIGETAIEIIGSSGFEFTQGFQQPRIKIKVETLPSGNGVNVYPNPVTDYVFVELFGNTTRSFRIDFVNITGTIVLTERKEFRDQFWYREPVSLQHFISGLYLVRITSEDGIINRTFKIQKL